MIEITKYQSHGGERIMATCLEFGIIVHEGTAKEALEEMIGHLARKRLLLDRDISRAERMITEDFIAEFLAPLRK